MNIDFDRNTLKAKNIKLPGMAFASAIASQMYEGFVPTEKSLSIMTDYANGKISIDDLADIAKNKLYA
jgi:hypothetical protein